MQTLAGRGGADGERGPDARQRRAVQHIGAVRGELDQPGHPAGRCLRGPDGARRQRRAGVSRYDLAAQLEVIGRWRTRCGVPLPTLRWNEPEGGPLGTPFFVMDQVEGQIPLDIPPYVFTGWLLEAAPSERARLQRASIAVLAKLHAIARTERGVVPGLRPPDGMDSLRSHVASHADCPLGAR